MDASDRTLLDRYLSGRDEAAFGILVRRYVDFVHAVALRVTGNDEMARDVAQATFIRFAQRAALIPPHLTLTAWLHRVTRLQAVDLVRAETRRKKRELSTTFLPSAMDDSDPEPDWSALAPVIDELVDHLPATDRELLLLRYYRNEPHAVIAARLGITEGVARKRAFRAMEKLRALLGKRGIATTTAALATLLPAHAAPASSALLSTSILQATQGIAPLVPSFFTSILLTVTATQKTAFAGSLLLLLAATGYTFAPDPTASSNVQTLPSTGSPGQRSDDKLDSARQRTARAVPPTPEERLERLKAIMAMQSTVDRHAELIAYFDGLPPALFEETLKFLVTYGKDPKSILLAASAWAKVDLPAALAYAAAQPRGGPGYGMDSQILKDWEILDPKAAIAWAATKSPRARGNVNAMLERFAHSAPEEVGQLIRDLPPGEDKYDSVSQLLLNIQSDPDLISRIIAGASESQRAVIYGQLASITSDPLEALAILKDHPESVLYSDPATIYSRWAGRDLAAATTAVAELPTR